MTDNYVQLNTDGSGKKIDVSELTIGANTVHRQRLVIGDNADIDNFVAVNTDGSINISQDVLITVITLLNAILEKMPRVDGADRLLISGSEVTQTVALAATQTLTTVSNVATISGMGTLARDTSSIPTHMSNAGVMHIYDNIRIT